MSGVHPLLGGIFQTVCHLCSTKEWTYPGWKDMCLPWSARGMAFLTFYNPPPSACHFLTSWPWVHCNCIALQSWTYKTWSNIHNFFNTGACLSKLCHALMVWTTKKNIIALSRSWDKLYCSMCVYHFLCLQVYRNQEPRPEDLPLGAQSMTNK